MSLQERLKLDLSSIINQKQEVKVVQKKRRKSKHKKKKKKKNIKKDEDDGTYDADFIEEYLSINKLKEASGEEDLTKVTYLELVVNTLHSTLSNLGEKLPNLKQLKLNNSTLSSIRDLGTSVRSLEVLWISRCNLDDISGLSIFANLKELYMSYNNIEEISELSSLHSLEILDMEGNNISEIDQLYFLKDLENLYSLNLLNNECANPRNEYLTRVKEILPNLELLDEFEINHVNNLPKKAILSSQEKKEYEEQKVLLKKELKFLNSSIKLTKIDNGSFDLLHTPRIICKAPRFISFEEKEDYIRKRPQTSRISYHRSKKRLIGKKKRRKKKEKKLHTTRPLSARLNSRFNYEKLLKYDQKKNTKGTSKISFLNLMEYNKNKELKAKEKAKGGQSDPKKENGESGKNEVEKEEENAEVMDDDALLRKVIERKIQKKFQQEEESEKNINILKEKPSFDVNVNEGELQKTIEKNKKKLRKSIEASSSPEESISPASPNYEILNVSISGIEEFHRTEERKAMLRASSRKKRSSSIGGSSSRRRKRPRSGKTKKLAPLKLTPRMKSLLQN